MFEYLTVFCVNGNTLRFNKVSNFKDDIFGDLQFDYKSESTGMSCHAVFDQAKLHWILICERKRK